MSFTENGITDCDRAICISKYNCSSYFCSTPKLQIKSRSGRVIGTIEEERPYSPEPTDPWDDSAHPIDTGLTNIGVLVFVVAGIAAAALIAYFGTEFLLTWLASTRGTVNKDLIQLCSKVVTGLVVVGTVIAFLWGMSIKEILRGTYGMLYALIVSILVLTIIAGLCYGLYFAGTQLLDKFFIRK